MKIIGTMGLLVAAIVGGCSSSNDAAPPCKIEGSYGMTPAIITGSAGCSDVPPATGTTAITITASGDVFTVEVQGIQGGCVATRTDSCKLQTKCDLQATDALDPNDAVATLQFAWTFDASGFRGTNSVAFPKATSLPRGCTGEGTTTATRR